MTPAETAYVKPLEHLWDMLSDCIESGRLQEADLPDDYAALVEQMATCNRLYEALDKEDENTALRTAAQQVVDRWESGDLAAAVRELDAVLNLMKEEIDEPTQASH